MSTEISNVSPRPTAFRYGGIIAVGLIVLGLIFQLTGIADPTDPEGAGNSISGCLNWVVIIVGVVMAIKHYKKEVLGGFITLGQSIGVGTLTALVIGVISAIWMYLYMGVIDPEMTEIIRENAIEQAEHNSGGQNMDQAMPWIEAFTSPVTLSIITLVGSVFIGFVTSLITGAIVKNEKPFA